METIETSYPLELIHIDFLTIGSKRGPLKDINVLVVTDRFTRYAQGCVTSNQTAKAVVQKPFIMVSWCITDGLKGSIVIRVVVLKVTSLRNSVK